MVLKWKIFNVYSLDSTLFLGLYLNVSEFEVMIMITAYLLIKWIT